jgi:hypothetical protein
MTLTLYSYHPETGEFVGTVEADSSPREPGVYLKPAFTTEAVPPPPVTGKARVFGQNGWQLLPDHRGENWWRDGVRAEVDFFGTPQSDAGWTDEPPPEAGEDEAVYWDSGAWIVSPDYRGEIWWDGDVPVLIDFLGNPSGQGLSRERGEVPEPEGPPTSEDVNIARDRRIDAGIVFNGVLFQTRREDRENIQGAYSRAQSAILIEGAQPGDHTWHGGSGDFEWIAADDSRVRMDAQTMMAFGEAVLDHKSALIFAANNIKAMDPIPADYATNESYWPPAAA